MAGCVATLAVLWQDEDVVLERFKVVGRFSATKVAAASLVVIAANSACQREVSAAEVNPVASASPAADPGSNAPASSQFDEAAFSLKMEPIGPYAVGKPGFVTIQLVAKGPHHVNQEYPHKLRLRSTDGVTYPQSVVSRDSMKVTPMRADVSVPFTPTRAGKLMIGGEFAFSLCTADRCLIEKRSLAVDVQVL